MRKRTTSMAVLFGLLLAFGMTLPAFAVPAFGGGSGTTTKKNIAAQKGAALDASVVLWDFEDGDISEWPGTADADLWMRENSVSGLVERGDWSSPFVTLYKGGQICPSCNTETFLATVENGGRVHGGENALGVTFDMRNVEFNSWIYGLIWNTQGNIVLRDVANGNDAAALGMWLYVPEGFRSEKNRSSLAFQLTVLKGANENSLSGSQLNLRYNGKNISSLQESDIPDNRWVYVTADLTGYNYVRLVDPANDIYRSPSFGRCYMKPSDAQVITLYLDDIELVYDDAQLDRTPPQILDPVGIAGAEEFAFGSEPVNENVLSFRAEVADADSAAISGIDATSAAILLDGCRLDDAAVDEGVLSAADVEVADGAHTVTFVIADLAGNVTELKKDFMVRSESGAITVSGHNELDNLPQAGSVYYIDLNAADIASVGSVTATLALHSANRWEPDHMIAAEGFTATYTVNACEPNRLTVTVTGAAAEGLTGEQTLVSIPVRVWAYDESTWVEGSNDDMVQMTAEERYNAYDEPVVTVEARTESGKAVFTDGREETFRGAVSRATAVTGDKSNGMWHTHTAEALPDIAATCVSDGCVGRTYCAVCGSFVDWGEKTSDGEHDYRFDSFVWNDDGTSAAVKLVCANDPAHVAFPDAEMSDDEYAPTCTTDAYTVYTATYGAFSEDHTVWHEGTAAGHNWDSPSWDWAENNAAATADFVCDVCGEDRTLTDDAPTLLAVGADRAKYKAAVVLDETEYTDETDPFAVSDLLSAPADLAAQAEAGNAVKLTWTGDPDAARYDVYRYNGTVKAWLLKGSVSEPTESGLFEYLDETGYENVNFYYRVKAVLPAENGELMSGWSNAAIALTYLNVPAPTDLQAEASADGAITLTWNGSENAVRYDVYRYNSTLKQYALRGSATGTSFTDTGLYAGTTYYYKVVAVWEIDGNETPSAYSGAAWATAKNGFFIPAALTAENAGEREIRVSCAPVEGAVAYRVYRYNSTLKQYVLKAELPANGDEAPEYTDKNVWGGITYYYKIAAVRAEDGVETESGLSQVVYVRADGAPYPPQNVTAQSDGERNITVSWSSVNGASGYEVYRYNSTVEAYVLKGTVSADETAFSDDTVYPGTTYYYRVKAVAESDEVKYESNFSLFANAQAR